MKQNYFSLNESSSLLFLLKKIYKKIKQLNSFLPVLFKQQFNG